MVKSFEPNANGLKRREDDAGVVGVMLVLPIHSGTVDGEKD
jgi:hypothetical protein